MSDTNDIRQLKAQLAQYIKEKRLAEGRTLLTQALRQFPEDADLYYAGIFLTDNREQRIKFLEKALTFNPQHQRARETLDKLRSSETQTTSTTPPEPAPTAQPKRSFLNSKTIVVMAVIAIVLVGLGIVGAVLSSNRGASPEEVVRRSIEALQSGDAQTLIENIGGSDRELLVQFCRGTITPECLKTMINSSDSNSWHNISTSLVSQDDQQAVVKLTGLDKANHDVCVFYTLGKTNNRWLMFSSKSCAAQATPPAMAGVQSTPSQIASAATTTSKAPPTETAIPLPAPKLVKTVQTGRLMFNTGTETMRGIAISSRANVLATLHSIQAEPGVKLWDTATGQEKQIAGSANKAIRIGGASGYGDYTLQFSPDESVLATFSRDGGVALTDTKSGFPIQVFKDTQIRANLSFLSDGTTLIGLAALENRIQSVDLLTGKTKTVTFTGCKRGGRPQDYANFSPDFSQCVNFDQKAINIWDVGLDTIAKTIPAPVPDLRNVFWSPNGKLLVGVYLQNKEVMVRLWDAASQEVIQTVNVGNALIGKDSVLIGYIQVALTPDNRFVVAVENQKGTEQRVAFYEAATGTLKGALKIAQRLTGTPLFDATGSRMVIALQNAPDVQIWDITPITGAVAPASPNGPTLAERLHGGSTFAAPLTPITAANASGLKLLHKMEAVRLSGEADMYAMHPDKKRFFLKDQIWNLETIASESTVAASKFSPVFAADGQAMIYVNGQDGTARVWDFAKQSDAFIMPKPKIFAVSADTKTIAILTEADVLRVWSIEKQQQITSLDAPKGSSEIAISSDGSRVAVLSEKAISVWDLPSGKQHLLKDETAPRLYGLVMNADGSNVLAQTNNKVRLIPLAAVWHVNSEKPISNKILAFALNSNYWSLVELVAESAVRGLTLKTWALNTQTQQKIDYQPKPLNFDQTFLAPNGSIVAIAYTPEGAANYSVFLYDLAKNQALATIALPTKRLKPEQIVLNADGSRLVFVSEQSAVWDTVSGKKIADLSGEFGSGTFASNGLLILTGNSNSAIYDTDKFKQVVTLNVVGIPEFALDGKVLLFKDFRLPYKLSIFGIAEGTN